MVSVIIPTYNRESLIKRAILSVLNQTYKDFEVIIVDDGSIDNTKLVVESINDNRISYFKLPSNGGLSHARNTGVSLAKGELVAFQDSDDEWLENKLEVQVRELYETNSDLVACAMNLYSNGEYISYFTNIDDSAIATRLLSGNFIGGPTILGKKECFINEPFEERIRSLEDWELMIRMSRKYKVHFINIPLINIYKQSDSLIYKLDYYYDAIELVLKKHENIYKDNLEIKNYLLSLINR